MSWPDIVNLLPNGWREGITFRKHFRADGRVSRIRRIRDANGRVREVWHDVTTPDGAVVHEAHLKYRYQEPTP